MVQSIQLPLPILGLTTQLQPQGLQLITQQGHTDPINLKVMVQDHMEVTEKVDMENMENMEVMVDIMLMGEILIALKTVNPAKTSTLAYSVSPTSLLTRIQMHVSCALSTIAIFAS